MKLCLGILLVGLFATDATAAAVACDIHPFIVDNELCIASYDAQDVSRAATKCGLAKREFTPCISSTKSKKALYTFLLAQATDRAAYGWALKRSGQRVKGEKEIKAAMDAAQGISDASYAHVFSDPDHEIGRRAAALVLGIVIDFS